MIGRPTMSIKERGLDNYLNETADIHNGFGYEIFLKLVDHQDVSNLARAFRVSRNTMTKWVRVYKQQ